MKIFSALFFFGLFNLGLGRTMESATIEKRFHEAKYAFKFRVISKSTKECFPGNNGGTTREPTTTMLPMTADIEPQTTDTNMVPASTQRFTTLPTTEAAETTLVPRPDTRRPTDRLATDNDTTLTDQTATKSTVLTSTHRTDLMSPTSITERTTETLIDQNSFTSQEKSSQKPTTFVSSTHGIDLMSPTSIRERTTETLTDQNSFTKQEKLSQKPTTFAQNQGEFKTTDIVTKENSIKEITVSSTGQPKSTEIIESGQAKQEFIFSTKPATPTRRMGDHTVMDNTILANTTESMVPRPARKKRSCEMLVYHQNIKILMKKMYKGCAEIRKMKRVRGMNKKFLKSTVRLQMGFSELRPNRNYFFMGRAVPGQDPSEYVFMADEFTVVNWKSVLKLRKKFKRSKDCARKGL